MTAMQQFPYDAAPKIPPPGKPAKPAPAKPKPKPQPVPKQR